MPDTMILARTIYLKINSRPATVYVLSFNFTLVWCNYPKCAANPDYRQKFVKIIFSSKWKIMVLFSKSEALLKALANLLLLEVNYEWEKTLDVLPKKTT